MKAQRPIVDQILLLIFAASILVVMYVLPRVTTLSASTLSQYLAYLAALLLAVDFLGKERINKADTVVSTNADYISGKFTDFLLYYYLIKVDDPKERREIGTWYLFCILDTVLLIVLCKHTLPSFHIDVGAWLKANNISIVRISLWIVMVTFLFSVAVSLLMFLAFFLKPWFMKVIGVAIATGSVLLLIAFTPFFLIGAPLTIPWLVGVGVTWLVLQALLLVVRLKRKLRLGNLFVVFGFVFLFASFLLFVLGQLKNK